MNTLFSDQLSEVNFLSRMGTYQDCGIALQIYWDGRERYAHLWSVAGVSSEPGKRFGVNFLNQKLPCRPDAPSESVLSSKT